MTSDSKLSFEKLWHVLQFCHQLLKVLLKALSKMFWLQSKNNPDLSVFVWICSSGKTVSMEVGLVWEWG